MPCLSASLSCSRPTAVSVHNNRAHSLWMPIQPRKGRPHVCRCDSQGICSIVCEKGTVKLDPWYTWASGTAARSQLARWSHSRPRSGRPRAQASPHEPSALTPPPVCSLAAESSEQAPALLRIVARHTQLSNHHGGRVWKPGQVLAVVPAVPAEHGAPHHTNAACPYDRGSVDQLATARPVQQVP
jgi:hypothetical protein